MKSDPTGGVVMLVLAALVAYGWWSGQLAPFLAKLQTLVSQGRPAAPAGPVATANTGVGRRTDALIDLDSYLQSRRVGGLVS